MCVYGNEEKKGNVDIVIYNLYGSPTPLLFTKFKPHRSEELSDRPRAPSRFRTPVCQQRPTELQDYLLRVVTSPTTNAPPATLLEPLGNFDARPLAPESSFKKLRNAGPPNLSRPEPEPVPPPTPAPCLWKPWYHVAMWPS